MFTLIVVWLPITMTLKQTNTYVVLIDIDFGFRLIWMHVRIHVKEFILEEN